MQDFIVKETFTTLRFIEAENEAAAIEKAKEGGLLDFDEIDHGRVPEMTVEIDHDMARIREQEKHDAVYSTAMISNEIRHFRDAAVSRMKIALKKMAVTAIVRTAKEFAPDATSYSDAVHEDGPDGIHALIAVEDEISKIFERNPELIGIMRSSIEWDLQVRTSDESRAALALVNESFHDAEKVWDEEASIAPKI